MTFAFVPFAAISLSFSAVRADITADWECEVLPRLKQSGSKEASSPEEQYGVGLGYACDYARSRCSQICASER
jgi:hypothetical protein